MKNMLDSYRNWARTWSRSQLLFTWALALFLMVINCYVAWRYRQMCDSVNYWRDRWVQTLKLLITAALIGSLVMTGAWAGTPGKTEVPAAPPADESGGDVKIASWALAALVLTCAVAGAAVVIYVHNKHKRTMGPVTLVLEKSPDNVNWAGVATNYNVKLTGDPYEMFRDVRRDGYSFYRVRTCAECVPPP